jgi:hypothetical protein
MTTDQEAENVANQVLHLMGKDARSWQAQSQQWERQCVELRKRVDGLEWQLSELLLLVGTPIAAFTLAETWRAEKAHVMDALSDLRTTACAVVDSECIGPLNYSPGVVLVSTGALRALERRVSSTQAEHEPAQSEETQAQAALHRILNAEGNSYQLASNGLGLCPRCNSPLNNLSPGISVVSGGVSVCTTCVRPGETEVLRAR